MDPPPTLGRKLRRTSSAGKLTLGDHAGLSTLPSYAALLAKLGDSISHYSEQVSKLSRSGELRPRLLAVTDRSVLLLEPQTLKLLRRIALKEIAGIWMSELPDNFLAILVPNEHDAFVAATHKTEAASALLRACHAATGSELRVLFDNPMTIRVGADLPVVVTLDMTDSYAVVANFSAAADHQA